MRRHGHHVRPVRQAARSSRRTLTRRGLVAGALGMAGTSAIGAGLGRPVGGWADLVKAVAAQTGDPLCEPAVVPSENGLLVTELIARDDFTRGPGAFAYEGGGVVCEGGGIGLGGRIPGPTLRLHPGDRLKLTLKNRLVNPFNVTNLHVHGLHVSPIGNSDNVFVAVESGGDYDIEVQLPESHPSGLFWYHPHYHHHSAPQVNAGLAGAIVIVERPGEPAALRTSLLESGARYPGPIDAGERLLVLQHLIPGAPPLENAYLVNGQILPRIAILPGETQRWQILNASSDTFFNLRVVGHRLTRIAVDGNWIPDYGSLPPLHVLPLGPAERAEVLITGETPGTFELRSLKTLTPGIGLSTIAPYFADPGSPFDDDMDPTEYTTLATLVVSEGGVATPVPSPPGIANAISRDIARADFEPDRKIRFTPFFQVDGKPFVAGRVDQTVRLEETEIWRIVNEHTADTGWHPFHIHVNDFDVLRTSLSGGELEPAYYQDTIPLPPKVGSDPGWVDVRNEFRDFAGRFVYHCHFLPHEDDGMMGVVEVAIPVCISPRGFEPASAAATSGPTLAGGVNSGTTVVWTNSDEHAVHTVTADSVDARTGVPLFDSGDLEKGRSFAHTFDAPGTIAYHCARHPDEQGVVVVTALKTIEIRNAAFEPATVEVAAGTTVSWTNREASAQAIAAGQPDPETGEPAFASGPLDQEASFSHTFMTPGDYAYSSTDDPGMEGHVIVGEVVRRSVSIGIFDDRLDQPVVIVPVGTTVTWANRSTQDFTVRSTEQGFDSGLLDPESPFDPDQPFSPGQRFSQRFDLPLSVNYSVVPSDSAAETHLGTIQVVP